MNMTLNFSQSKFTTSYSFDSARSIVRKLSDAFSKQHCDVKQAPIYAAEQTKGCCLYCGQPLYSIRESKAYPVFSNTLHYDHIYPASKLNLFEVGNVALACETCNLDKSNKLPMDYYDYRLETGKPLFIHEREEFEAFLDNMVSPYKEKWPSHYESNFLEMDDDEFKAKLTELLFDDLSFSAQCGSKYNQENSVNWEIWKKAIEKGYATYTALTAKDIEGRIGYTNEFFEDMFGIDKLLSGCTYEELSDFTTKLLLSKYESKNEVQKYRMLIRMLSEVLNEEYLTGQLEGFYEEVPTYSKISIK